MRGNLNELIRQQFIDQFDNVVREEIRKHNLSIAFTNRELAQIKENFDAFKVDHDKLVAQNKKFYEDTQKKFEEEKKKLQDDYDDERLFISKSIASVDKSLSSLTELASTFITKGELENSERKTENIFQVLSKELERLTQFFRGQLNEKFLHLQNEIYEVREQSKIEGENVVEDVRELDRKVESYRLEAASILRELQIYKKNMFIIEKKIEQLYTLIQRLDKRIAACHKPD